MWFGILALLALGGCARGVSTALVAASVLAAGRGNCSAFCSVEYSVEQEERQAYLAALPADLSLPLELLSGRVDDVLPGLGEAGERTATYPAFPSPAHLLHVSMTTGPRAASRVADLLPHRRTASRPSRLPPNLPIPTELPCIAPGVLESGWNHVLLGEHLAAEGRNPALQDAPRGPLPEGTLPCGLWDTKVRARLSVHCTGDTGFGRAVMHRGGQAF